MPGSAARLAELRTPCADCRHRRRCAVEHLACDRFLLFAYGEGPSRWAAAPCCPSAARYEALFNP